MNYCEKIHYHIYTAAPDVFDKMADALLAQLPADEQWLRLSFFGMPTDNGQYVEQRRVLQEKIKRLCGNRQPVLSYVAQPPLNGGLTLEVHAYRTDPTDRLAYRIYKDFPYVLLENEDGRFLFAGGFQGDVVRDDIQQQATDVFRLLTGLMQQEGFPINSIIRQWNYIERITAFDGPNQHYQMFNNARSECYARTVWNNGYPAATGIGACRGGVLVDVDAAVLTRNGCYATPIDNKLQVAAHAYSEQVLATAHRQKATPKFERAKSMTFDSRRLVYLSGTAAIRGENSLTGVGLDRQLHTTMENIAQLTDEARPRLLRVYLKEKSFYDPARRLMESYHLPIPVAYMWADICRDELLIEIEGIAIE